MPGQAHRHFNRDLLISHRSYVKRFGQHTGVVTLHMPGWKLSCHTIHIDPHWKCKNIMCPTSAIHPILARRMKYDPNMLMFVHRMQPRPSTLDANDVDIAAAISSFDTSPFRLINSLCKCDLSSCLPRGSCDESSARPTQVRVKLPNSASQVMSNVTIPCLPSALGYADGASACSIAAG